MANLLMLFFIYSVRNPWNVVYCKPRVENFLTNFYSSSLSYSSNNKLVSDWYEAGYLIANADLCPDLGENMKLMILVTSALDHSEARMAIRQTWSFYGRHHDVGVGFVVGTYKQSSKYDIIHAEQHTYGDLIQTRMVDSLDNVTLKTISMLEWVDTYCTQVPFMLKTDDDMFINIPLLLTLLEKQQPAKRSIFGRLVRKWRPLRNVDSKYYLSKSEYEPDIYPDFLTGSAILITQDSVHDLYHQALRTPYLRHLDDVVVTGFAAASIGLQLINIKAFKNLKIPFNITQICETISIHDIIPHEQFLLWSVIFENRTTDSSQNIQPFEYQCGFPEESQHSPSFSRMMEEEGVWVWN